MREFLVVEGSFGGRFGLELVVVIFFGGGGNSVLVMKGDVDSMLGFVIVYSCVF